MFIICWQSWANKHKYTEKWRNNKYLGNWFGEVEFKAKYANLGNKCKN